MKVLRECGEVGGGGGGGGGGAPRGPGRRSPVRATARRSLDRRQGIRAWGRGGGGGGTSCAGKSISGARHRPPLSRSAAGHQDLEQARWGGGGEHQLCREVDPRRAPPPPAL